MLTTSLLSLVPEALDALSDDDASLDAELLSSVELVDVVEVVEPVEPTDEVSVLESLASVVISGGGGGGGGAMAVPVVSPEVVVAVASFVEAEDDVSEDGGGGGGPMAASVFSPEAPDVVVSLVEAADGASEEGGGGGGVVAVSVPPISSCNDSNADCISLLSDEKALPDDTVPDVEVLDVELLLWLLDEDGAKALAVDVPLLLDAPKRAARLLVLLVRAERDDICCLREKLPLQL